MNGHRSGGLPGSRRGWLVCLLVLAGLLAQGWDVRAAGKPILAHYMPWYVARPHSANWGWHWTMNHFNPDVADETGRRQIAARHYPVIGPYDSADPVVLEYHCLLMKLAGIDGVIVDWYGKDEFLDYGLIDRRTKLLLAQTQRAGLTFSLCYEDRTIQAMVDGGYIGATGAIAQAQATMRYAATNYFSAPNHQSLGSRPLLLNFGPQYFKSGSQWTTIFSVLPASNRPAFFTEDSRVTAAQGAFNWPPMWQSATNNGVVSLEGLEAYLAGFEKAGAGWPAYISSAFPRFHDIYLEAGLGYTHGVLDDRAGETFRSTLRRALTNSAAAVQLVTWNDFGEGTILEPTREFGFRDLVTVQELRRSAVDPGFACREDDLALPLRLYQLRRQHAANAVVSAELDRVFTHLVTGNLAVGRLQLSALEARMPAIYGAGQAAGQLRFSVGGYLAEGVVEVQSTPDLRQPDWVTVWTLQAGVSEPVVSLEMPDGAGHSFVRVRVSAAPGGAAPGVSPEAFRWTAGMRCDVGNF